MMGERRVMQEALFFGFSLERHVRTITCFARYFGVESCRACWRLLSKNSGVPSRAGAPAGRIEFSLTTPPENFLTGVAL